MRKLVSLLLLLLLAVPAFAHPGSTDSQGGHLDHSTGEYHFHHGKEPHQHPNGECPLGFDDETDASYSSSSAKASASYSKSKATAKPTNTPKPTKKPSAGTASRSYPITYVNGMPVKEVNPMSSVTIPQLLPFISFGFALGTIAASVIWRLFYNRLRAKEAARRALIESEHAKATARLQFDNEQSLKLLEAEYADQMVRFENSHLMEMNKTVNRLEREIESSRTQFNNQKSQLERFAANRHAKAFRLMQELHSLSHQPETLSLVESIISIEHEPDLSEGAVYVKRDLPVAVYHYRSFCTDNLVLASKATMKSLGFRPCPCCYNTEQPVLDPTVAISGSTSEVYHDIGAPCIKHGGKIIFLSHALRMGRRPCKMCRPVDRLPDVWY